MCKSKRLGQISLLLLCIALLAMMSGCGRLIPIRQPSTGTDLTETSKETDPTVNIKDTEMTEEALVALTMMRQSLVETPCLFAAAFLGYLEAPTGDLAAWLPQGVNAQLLEDLPFVREIPPAQTIGDAGYLYCVVPRDEQASVAVNRLSTEEVLYRSETGEPVLLFCGAAEDMDMEVVIVAANGEQVTWYPVFDADGYLLLPKNGAGEALAMDFTYYFEDGYEYNPKEWFPGWQAPYAEDLRQTSWNVEIYSGSEEMTEYSMELYGGDQPYHEACEGEATISCLREGDAEYWRLCEGWWYLEEVEGETCLCLSLTYLDGESNQTVTEKLPLLLDPEGTCMVLFRDQTGEAALPFFEEKSDFTILTRAFG